jgi:hypothetical protein
MIDADKRCGLGTVEFAPSTNNSIMDGFTVVSREIIEWGERIFSITEILKMKRPGHKLLKTRPTVDGIAVLSSRKTADEEPLKEISAGKTSKLGTHVDIFDSLL